MRRGFDRSLNIDLFDDQWLWLQSTEPLAEEVPPWTNEEIVHIYDYLVEDSLRNLFDGRCSMETLVEIVNWLMNIDDPNPFSFTNCCKVSGFDPDEIRDAVLNKFKSVQNRKLH
jgi:hypothetical protein